MFETANIWQSFYLKKVSISQFKIIGAVWKPHTEVVKRETFCIKSQKESRNSQEYSDMRGLDLYETTVITAIWYWDNRGKGNPQDD